MIYSQVPFSYCLVLLEVVLMGKSDLREMYLYVCIIIQVATPGSLKLSVLVESLFGFVSRSSLFSHPVWILHAEECPLAGQILRSTNAFDLMQWNQYSCNIILTLYEMIQPFTSQALAFLSFFFYSPQPPYA